MAGDSYYGLLRQTGLERHEKTSELVSSVDFGCGLVFSVCFLLSYELVAV